MLYIVNFDIKDLARAEQFAQQLNEVGETLLFMNGWLATSTVTWLSNQE